MLWDFIRRRSSNRLNSNPEWEKNTWNIDYYDEKKPVTNMWNETIKTNFIRKNQQQQNIKQNKKLNICVLNYLRFKFPVSFKPYSKKCWEKIDSNFKSNIKVKIVIFSCCYDQEMGIFCSFAIVCVQSCKVLHFQIVQFIIWWEIIDLAFRENRSNTIFERKVRCTREVKQK